jgi:hypothetical protein
MKWHVVCHCCPFEGLAPSEAAAERAVDAHHEKEEDCRAEFEVMASA